MFQKLLLLNGFQYCISYKILYLCACIRVKIVCYGYQLKKNNARWVYTFWARRFDEGNTAAVLTILRSMQEQ